MGFWGMPPTRWPAGGIVRLNRGGRGQLTGRRHNGSELDGQVLIAVLILQEGGWLPER